jgi:hypothetical protein
MDSITVVERQMRTYEWGPALIEVGFEDKKWIIKFGFTDLYRHMETLAYEFETHEELIAFVEKFELGFAVPELEENPVG